MHSLRSITKPDLSWVFSFFFFFGFRPWKSKQNTNSLPRENGPVSTGKKTKWTEAVWAAGTAIYFSCNVCVCVCVRLRDREWEWEWSIPPSLKFGQQQKKRYLLGEIPSDLAILYRFTSPTLSLSLSLSLSLLLNEPQKGLIYNDFL